MQFRSSSDKAPALSNFLNSTVEAEEQEDISAGDALVVEMTLRGAGLAKHSSPFLPAGSFLTMPVDVEVKVGV